MGRKKKTTVTLKKSVFLVYSCLYASVDRFLHSPFDRSGNRPSAECQLDTSPRPNDPGRPPRSTRPIWQGRGQQRSATVRGGERGTGSGGPGAGDVSMMRVDVLDVSHSRSLSLLGPCPSSPCTPPHSPHLKKK